MTTSKQIFSYNEKTNGSHPPIICWSQDSSYLAVGTQNRYVYVMDKKGKMVADKEFPIKGRVEMMDWDNENQLLAVLIEGQQFVYLWAPNTTNTVQELHFENQKIKISWLKWSRTHPVLTFGNEKGYLNFYLKKNKRKIPTMGKHSKKIIAGDWNEDGLLVTGSEDRIITISNHNSDNAGQSLAVKHEPKDIKWITIKNEDRSRKQSTISAILNQKTLLIYDTTQEGVAPIELVFESKYGKIIDYQFFGDGYVLLGFSEGYYCHVSTHIKQVRDEIRSERIFNAPLEAMAVSNIQYKAAFAGEGKIKVYNINDWKEIRQQTFQLPPQTGKVAKMEFAHDGSSLVITTQTGLLLGYILSTNMIVSPYNQLLAILSSLTEVVLMNCNSKRKGQIICNVNLNVEPAGLALGPSHLAVRVGNTVTMYKWLKDKSLIPGGEVVGSIDYECTIKKMELNQNYIGVLSERNKVHLQSIENRQIKQRIFPLEGDKQILQFFLTKHFLILLDNTSKLKFYHIEDKNIIMEHKSDNPILRIYPNKNGTKIIFHHQNGDLNLFFPATETYHHINNNTDRVDRIIWDNENPNQFVILNGNAAYSYVITRSNIYGNVVSPVNEILSLDKVDSQQGDPAITRVQKGVISLSQGNLFFMTGSAINYVCLTSHAFLNTYTFENDSDEGHSRYFFVNIALKRLNNCLAAAKFLKNSQYFQALGKKALQNLQLDTSLKSYQIGKNLAMVLTIQPLIHQNEKNLLIAHVAMILGKYQLAQQYYLKSSEPLNALDMRCDIQDWFVASSLTKTIAPEQEQFISKRLATQTESQGNYTQALKQFQKSVINGELKTIEKATIEKHNVECFAGIARTSIKLGDIQRGFNIARDLKNKSLLIDIAVVCENMKQFLQAAQLYEKAQSIEKAATLYFQLKMFKQAAPLMKKVKTPSILMKYGKAKESEGSFKEAQQAYQDAQAWEDVVRINLNNFDNLEKPKQILREKCSTSTVALMVAHYCEKRGFWKEAVQFSIMANRKQEAFIMAQTHGEMDTYADCLKECTTEERNQIAQYYEGKSQWDKAAKQYEEAKNPLKALKLWIKAGEIFIDKMLQLIEKNSNQQHLVQEVLDYLMGQSDGQPKDPIYTYKLYRILKNYRNAAKIAVTIASQEQESGNYPNAHEILFQSYQDIKKANVPVPMELEKKISILHSYIIAIKRLAKMDNHVDTALLLDKVAKNISQFPVHASNILTTIVIKAMRAQMKGLAYNWAIVVVRPQYKAGIPQKYVDRIKKVAMKPVKDQIPDPKSPCPFCREPVSDYQDDCPKCLNYLPFCIASGKHIVADDLSFCKNCKFPFNYTYMKKMLQFEGMQQTCPMCNAQMKAEDLAVVGEAGVNSLKRITPAKDEKKNEGEKNH